MNFDILFSNERSSSCNHEDSVYFETKLVQISAPKHRWIRQAYFGDDFLLLAGYLTGEIRTLAKLHELLVECCESDNLINLKRLSGNFAFAYYCSNSNSIILSTDISGTIPLYQVKNDSGIYISTSISRLSQHLPDRSINARSFVASLCNFPLESGATYYNQLSRLNPEGIYSYSTNIKNSPRVTTFTRQQLLYDPSVNSMEESELVVMLQDYLSESVTQITSNGGATVPLSGGLDSGNVWGAALRAYPEGNDDLTAFTCSFGTYDCDETALVESWKKKHPAYTYVFHENTFNDYIDYFQSLPEKQDLGLVLDRGHTSFSIANYSASVSERVNLIWTVSLKVKLHLLGNLQHAVLGSSLYQRHRPQAPLH